MGPVEIDGTDAKHPVPFKDGYPTVDDCYNTAHDFAIKCKFARRHPDDRRPAAATTASSSRAPRAGSSSTARKSPASRSSRSGTRASSARTTWCASTRASRSKVTTPTSIRCIREGGLPVSDVFSHVQTMNTCHLCAIAARLGRVIHWDPKAEKIVGDDQAAAFFARTPRPGFEIPGV